MAGLASRLSSRRRGRAAGRAVALVVALGLAAAGPAHAWSRHALCTWPALSVLPQVAAAAPVPAERLADFVRAEAAALPALLEAEERWAREHVVAYPARPDALAFKVAPDAPPDAFRRAFLAALRVQPESRLSLFVQVPPGREAAGRPALAPADVATLARNEAIRATRFVALAPGEAVAPIDVVATASDEPDHGLDVGLWVDSGTAWGRDYGFGRQPFGVNPAIEFSSQSPFHLGYFHESAIVYKAAPFLLRTYPEYRIHLYRTLATHAFRSGHPYWGWRFTGWALHYVQDLTQPYHARVLPGVGVASMLWINALDLAGFPQKKNDAVALVTNRHLALENYQAQRVLGAWQRGDFADPPMAALRDTRRDARTPMDADRAPRDVVAREAHAEADALDATLASSLPARYISDPAYVFGETEPDVDLFEVVARSGPRAQERMGAMLVRLLGDLGRQTRAFVAAVAPPAR